MYTAHEIAPTGSDDARVAPKAPVCLRQAPGTSRQAPGTSPMQQHRGFRQLRPPTVSFSSRRARPGTQLGFPGSVGESSAGLNLDSLWKAAAVTGCSARRWASGPSAGPSFSAAAPPARRRWPRPAAAQAQKYGPMPETEPRQLRGVETKRGAKVPAQAGQEKKRGFFRIDGRLGPSKPSPPPLSPTHTHTPPDTHTVPRAWRHKLRGRYYAARVSRNLFPPADAQEGEGGAGSWGSCQREAVGAFGGRERGRRGGRGCGGR